MQSALLIACGLLLAGFVLRTRLRIFERLYLPASIVGGLLGLMLVQAWKAFASLDQTWLQANMDELARWPGWLIAVVFAGLLLERPGRSVRDSLRLAAREGLMVYIIALGQAALGLLVTWLVIQRFYDVPPAFGMLIETGFAGGHGTAAAMGRILESESVGMAAGTDLGLFMATVGLVFSVVSGMIYVNLAVRLGWTQTGGTSRAQPDPPPAAAAPRPIAFTRISPGIIEPLVFPALMLALAFAAGLALHQVSMLLLPFTEGYPLFMYTLIGGLLVRRALTLIGGEHLIDAASVRSLTSAAMEFLVVAAITSLKIEAVLRQAGPITILLIVAFAWTGVCLLVIGRYVLPRKYWFELGIINYGMSTGTTATGFVLLRAIDQQLDTGAAEDYALAAPLSSPFVGGGLITFSLPLLLHASHVWLPTWDRGLGWREVPPPSIGLVATCLTLLVAILIVIGIRTRPRP